MRAALSTQKAAERTLSAAKAERYPVLSSTGNYANVGTTLGHSHGTFGFQAGVSIPVFTGGHRRRNCASRRTGSSAES